MNYDNNIFTEEAVGEFITFFHESIPQATVPIKMYVLEDHAVPWAKSFQFGLLDEQGALSSHDLAYHTLQLLIKYSISYV